MGTLLTAVTIYRDATREERWRTLLSGEGHSGDQHSGRSHNDLPRIHSTKQEKIVQAEQRSSNTIRTEVTSKV